MDSNSIRLGSSSTVSTLMGVPSRRCKGAEVAMSPLFQLLMVGCHEPAVSLLCELPCCSVLLRLDAVGILLIDDELGVVLLGADEQVIQSRSA